MAANLTAIKNQTIEESKEIIASELAIPFSRLKQQAQRFLYDLNAIYQGGAKERQHTNGKTEIMRLWSIYRDKATSQALAQIQNTFALALDSYLEREIILTYVDNKTGQLMLYSALGEIQILEKVGKNAGRANFSAGAWKKAQQIKDIPPELRPGSEQDLVKMINDSANKRAEVYTTAYERYLRVHNKKRKDSINTDLKKQYYIRKSRTEITFPYDEFSLGQMAEAYANAVVDDNNKILNTNLESSLWTLWYRYIRGHKDNVEAIITGDVKVGRDGKISLAVKGQSASTAKIGQYIVAALWISEMDVATPEDIKKWLETIPSVDKYAKEVEQTGFDSLEEYLNQYVASFSLGRNN